jgi:hypothetical protein
MDRTGEGISPDVEVGDRLVRETEGGVRVIFRISENLQERVTVGTEKRAHLSKVV